MRKRRRDGALSTMGEGQFSPIVRLWILRLLIPLGGSRNFVGAMGWDNDRVAEGLGFEVANIFNDTESYKPVQALKMLKELHLQAEERAQQTSHMAGLPPDLLQNASTLTERLGMSEVERDILVFTIMLHSERELGTASDYLGRLTNANVFAVLAILLGHSESDISRAFSGKSKLVSSGLVSLSMCSADDLGSRLDMLSSQFGCRMMMGVSDPMQLIRDTVSPGQAPTLAISDYDHVGKDMTLLLAYIKTALETERRGVNIFVYGPPGTGKTELARVVASQIGCELFEVSSEDEDGDSIKGEQRLRSYRAAQSFFPNHKALLVFDEAEDIFNDGSPFGGRSTAQVRKAWFNRMLEGCLVPTIWLSNSRHGLDTAFIRRFDQSFKLDIPPEKKRKEILSRIAGDYLSEGDLSLLASAEQLAPAVMTRAVSVLESIRHCVEPAEHAESLRHLINNTLETQGHGRIGGEIHTPLPTYYDPALINTTDDLDEIGQALKETPMARVCLYGPPGTGKTAFGHWLASTLEKPLLVKKASDLLSKYIGGTEENIAAAFRAAKQDGAILLIDEVDTFLRDRRQSDRSWESSMVNEMLTQMEGFNGVFVASTNLMEGLDQASLRRFDIKLKFDYLKPEQAWALLCKQCEAFGLPRPAKTLRTELASIPALTPGDFAVVARQQRFRKRKSAREIIALLREEAALKEGGHMMKRPIGFVH